jgi:hypothetical protein
LPYLLALEIFLNERLRQSFLIIFLSLFAFFVIGGLFWYRVIGSERFRAVRDNPQPPSSTPRTEQRRGSKKKRPIYCEAWTETLTPEWNPKVGDPRQWGDIMVRSTSPTRTYSPTPRPSKPLSARLTKTTQTVPSQSQSWFSTFTGSRPDVTSLRPVIVVEKEVDMSVIIALPGEPGRYVIGTASSAL